MDKFIIIGGVVAVVGIGAYLIYDSLNTPTTANNGIAGGQVSSVPTIAVSNDPPAVPPSNLNNPQPPINVNSNTTPSYQITPSDTGGIPVTIQTSNGGNVTVVTGGNSSYGTYIPNANGGGTLNDIVPSGTLSNVNYNGGGGGGAVMPVGTVLTSPITTNGGTHVPAGATFIGNGGYEKNGNYYY